MRSVLDRKTGNGVEQLYRELVSSDVSGLTFHDALDDVRAQWSVLESPRLACELTTAKHVRNSVLSAAEVVLKIRATAVKKAQQTAARIGMAAARDAGGTAGASGQKRRCSICQQEGHNKRKCQNK